MLAGAYPSDEFAELKPRSSGTATTDVIDGPARRAGRRGHERRDDPGPRAVRRVHGRRGRHARPAGRRARRGDGLREPDRRGHHAGRQQLADRGDLPRPGHGLARAGRSGKLPFWHGDAVGRPIELGRALGAFVGEVEADLGRGPKAGGPRSAGCASTTTSTRWRPRTSSPISRTSARRPAPCRPTSASSSSASATSSATGGSCC